MYTSTKIRVDSPWGQLDDGLAAPSLALSIQMARILFCSVLHGKPTRARIVQHMANHELLRLRLLLGSHSR